MANCLLESPLGPLRGVIEGEAPIHTEGSDALLNGRRSLHGEVDGWIGGSNHNELDVVDVRESGGSGGHDDVGGLDLFFVS